MKKIWALVPIKDFADAKTRLATTLTQDERQALAVAMARDVLAALVNSNVVERVIIVSDIPDVVGMLNVTRTEVFETGQARGLNRDLAAAADWAYEQGATHIIVTHADLPFLTSSSIEELILDQEVNGADSSQTIRAAASRDGSGTNILLTPLPVPLPFLFGPNSLNNFRAAARAAKIHMKVINNTCLATDIDELEDYRLLTTACKQGKLVDSATATHLLARMTSMQYMRSKLSHSGFGEIRGLDHPDVKHIAATR